jgi:hypothetical protein
VDNYGNLFIATGDLIRRVDATTGIITTVAGGGDPPDGLGDGGLATSASLRNPDGVVVDSFGNIFIAEDDRDRVRRVDASTGIITTYAGTGAFGFSGDGGLATSATFRFPSRVAVDAQGNLFIADLGNDRIRRVDANTGIITTIAGGGNPPDGLGDGGPATAAKLSFAYGLDVDGGRNLFFVDGHRVRRVDAATQIITTVAGTGVAGFSGDGGPAIDATFDDPFDVVVDQFGNLTITDTDNSRIRRVFLGIPDDEGPTTSNVVATPNPVAVNTAIALTANVDDTNTGGSTIEIAAYDVDGNPPVEMSAQDTVYDAVSENVVATVPAFSEGGVREICVLGRDTASNIGSEECILLAVYDPNAGFVTGGGWIWSPAGAYTLDPTLSGKANFGFVSKYQKGTTVPTGNTEFNFKTGNLNFYSQSYEWLVVTMGGTNAQYKGSGTINGGLAPNNLPYKFMLWARDSSPDTFRIKIWYESNGEIVVDDNGFDQPIGGGNIKIHTK